MFVLGLNLGIFRETYEYGRLSDVCNVNVSVNIYDEGKLLNFNFSMTTRSKRLTSNQCVSVILGSIGIHGLYILYIPNDETQSYPSCRLQSVNLTLYTQPNELTNQNLIKVPKVVKPSNKKTLL